jgi:hypothetical protein
VVRRPLEKEHGDHEAEADGVVIGSLIAAWSGWRGSFYKLVVHPDRRRQILLSRLGGVVGGEGVVDDLNIAGALESSF